MAVYPLASDVRDGVSYGPTGAEYTGTLTVGSIPSASDIAAAVRSDLSAELSRLSKLAYLSGIDATLVISQTSRTAGPVTQTISTSGGTITIQSI